MDLPAGTRVVSPDHFNPANHYYPRVLNAQLHPLVRFFMSLDNHRITERYCHLHPEAKRAAVRSVLGAQPRWFQWGGADLFATTTAAGERRIVVIETNSCPSGQKSMPRADEVEELGGYHLLLRRSFLPLLKRRQLPRGCLAVLFDKNELEASGYAAAMADVTGEPVRLVPCPSGAADPLVRVGDGRVLQLRDPDGSWIPMRAGLRYVTQRPWDRIPPLTRTVLLNPVVACLAGGRNKLLAAKAYDVFNAEMRPGGLGVITPETIWDVPLEQVPLWVRRMGGIAVVKVPYTNAGQGVYTVTNAAELEAFMGQTHPYDRFIVQSLIGNAGWSSLTGTRRLYHVGTVPDRAGRTFVADLRMMVGASPEGFYPVALYARRTRTALAEALDGTVDSWSMLGTNLSVKLPDGGWTTETERLMLMDSRDFNRLGLGLDDLIEAYLQTVMAMTAIDRMASHLVTKQPRFRKRAFVALTPDPRLAEEIIS